MIEPRSAFDCAPGVRYFLLDENTECGMILMREYVFAI